MSGKHVTYMFIIGLVAVLIGVLTILLDKSYFGLVLIILGAGTLYPVLKFLFKN